MIKFIFIFLEIKYLMECIVKTKMLILILSLMFINNRAIADEPSLQKQLNKQNVFNSEG